MTYGVITITRNAEQTILRTIESVLSQDAPPSQYVLVDGGSRDTTCDIIDAKIAAAREQNLPTRVWLEKQQKPQGGIPAAWNQGLAHLDCDIVSILNGDDWFEPGAAAWVLKTFQEQPDVELLATAIRMHDPERQSVRVARPRPFLLFPLLMPVMHPGCFVRRGVYDRVGDFDEHYRVSADYDFVYRCRRAGISMRRFHVAPVNMQAGGMAGRNRRTARRETREIALRHTRCKPLPWLAWALRSLTGR